MRVSFKCSKHVTSSFKNSYKLWKFFPRFVSFKVQIMRTIVSTLQLTPNQFQRIVKYGTIMLRNSRVKECSNQVCFCSNYQTFGTRVFQDWKYTSSPKCLKLLTIPILILSYNSNSLKSDA